MRDILNMKLNAILVSLSECQTGLGQFIRGKGVEGLSRAFFYSGASSVLMSLWAVNDEATYRLMDRFCSHLRRSKPLAGELRDAKLEMINLGAPYYPYYWSGFAINGKTDLLVFPASSRFMILLSSLFGLILILLIFRTPRADKS